MPTVDELHSCDKFFITPDADDWNPNCTSFEMNEKAMLTYQGELASPSSRSNSPMLLENEAEEAFKLAGVTCDQWEQQIDANISSINFMHNDIVHSSPQNEDASFSAALSTRCEISKLWSTIGSCSVNHDPCAFFESPSDTMSKFKLYKSCI